MSIKVHDKMVTRSFAAPSPTGPDGKTQLSWSVGRPRGGYTVRINVTATYQGQTANNDYWLLCPLNMKI